MALAQRALRDINRVTTLLAVASDGSQVPIEVAADPITNRLLVTATLSGNPLSATPIVGQSLLSVTGTATVLGSGPLINGVIITANASNASFITLGTSSVTNTTNGSGNGYVLQAGGSISFAVANLSSIWVNGSAGDWVSYAGS